MKIFACVAALCLSTTAMAQTWNEVGDAGNILTGIQNTQGAGALTSITGVIDSATGDYIDAYCFTITSQTAFWASTSSPSFDGASHGHKYDPRLSADPPGAPGPPATRIDFLKGGPPGPTVFVVFALVAFVPKLMTASLDAAKSESAYFCLGAIFVLGLVYMMVGLTDRRKEIPGRKRE